jgi:uncharacterized protein (DUF433 family)
MVCMSAITINPNIQGGVPCFAGTRVPVVSLFDHLKLGYTVEQFLADFPSVKKDQVNEVLELAKEDVRRHADHVAAG